MNKHLIKLALASAAIVATGPSLADTESSTFQVTATVAATCAVSATNLNFGAYTPGAAVTQSSTISVNCTNGRSYTVALDDGSTVGGTMATRLMSDGSGNTLQYNLYTTNGYTTVFGDGTGGSATQTFLGAGMSAANTRNITVYGRVPDSTANQDAPASASYADTVSVTVEF